MATEQQDNGSAEGTSDQEQQQDQQNPAEGTSGQEGQQSQAPAIDKKTRLPEDHPLIVSYTEVKGKLAKQATELAEAQANSKKATQLEEELAKRPTPEAMETLQGRYDRLEAFLIAAGGPIGKALDSRTFTRDLFETDKEIAALVKDWHKSNPSPTTAALTAGAAGDRQGNVDKNALLRAAAGKG